jgi:putative ABC transport system ATP-binding protein
VALIELQGLTKHYQMGTSVVHALDGVDLEIQRGEFVAITGASGSGKSTLMHLVGCLDRPSAGRIIFDGRDISALSDRQLAHIRNRQIGFVFQTFNLINRVSALDNVGVPLFYARQASTREPARRALERVGLAARATHRSNELSGGERQRVAIARAIVNDPPLLLADEPTGNLDSQTGQQIMELFHTLNAQGVTIVVVTHEYDIALQTQRIVQMRDGRVVSDCLTADLEAEPAAAWSGRQPHPAKRMIAASSDTATAVASAPPTAAARVPTAAGAPRRPPPAPVVHPVSGATASLVLGLLGVLFFVATAGGALLVQSYGFSPAELQGADPSTVKVPQGWMVAVLLSCASLAVGIILSIIAIVVGVIARRRIRREPDNWTGGRRALAGMLLGIAGVVGPPLIPALVSMLRGGASG